MAGEPTVNPNALGAPAEGFGQTVSFVYDPRGTEPPIMRTPQSRGPSIGVSGGGGASAPQVNPNSVKVAPNDDPTAKLLMKVGNDILGAKIEEARSTQYVEGMQRAMAGEGIKEIKESVPWYARLFGETPMEAGASAYTAQDTVNRAISEQTSNIAQIAKLGPAEAGKHFNDVIKKSLTGDSATDAIIMKGMGENLPTLMKAQAKANYGWKQSQAAQAMGASMQSGSSNVQQFGEQFANGTITEDDYKVIKDKYVASILPPAGIDEEHYQKALTSNLLGAAQRGEFHAIEALRSSGVLGALTADQALRVEGAITAGAKKQRNNYATKYLETMAEIESDAKTPPAGSTANELKARIEKADAQFKKLTGNPEGLWSSDEKKDMLEQSLNAFKAADKATATAARVVSDKNATEAAKAAAAVEVQQRIERYVSNGQAELVKKMDGVKSDDVDLAVYTMAKKDPEAGAKMLRLNWANGSTSKLISNELQAPMNMAASSFAQGDRAPPDSFFQSVQVYRQMEQQGGSAFANAYFGEHAKAMAFASYMLKDKLLGNPNAAAIYGQAMTVKDFRGEQLPHKEQEALVKKVISEGKTWLPQWAGGAGLRGDASRRLAAKVTDGVQQWKLTGKSDEEATAMALNDILGPKDGSGARTGGAGAEIIGGYMVDRTVGSSQETLASLMEGKGANYSAIPNDLKSNIFGDFMKDKVKVPPEAQTVDIVRLPDAAGNAQFSVSYTDKDGISSLRAFSASDLQTFSKEQTKWKRMPRWTGSRGLTTEETAAYNDDKTRREATPVQPIQTTFGPAINYTPENQARGVAIARQQVIDSMKTTKK